MPTVFDPNLVVRLVWDGDGPVQLPPEMGEPTPDQFQGTEYEKLVETDARVCYDSYGYDERGKPRGRSSVLLHDHLRAVENHSVYDQAVFTVRLAPSGPVTPEWSRHWAVMFLNRPGIWVDPGEWEVRLTLNLRAVVEWGRHSGSWNRTRDSEHIGNVLGREAARLAPRVFPEAIGRTSSQRQSFFPLQAEVIPAYDAHSAWAVLYFQGSRGFSHELVRHHWECGVSQRSTRYCDESSTPYIMPPLLDQYFADPQTDPAEAKRVWAAWREATAKSRDAYDLVNEALQGHGVRRGLERTPARKQARGAARGILGNSLMTCLIFGASLAQWRWMLKKRLSALADPEIRLLFGQVFPILQQSRHGHYLTDFDVEPSPDGIGEVLVDRGTRKQFV
jgi:hypothetical protein